MVRRSTFRAAAAAGAVLILASACSSGGSTSSGGNTSGGATSESSGPKQVKVYGTDGNVGNALGKEFSTPGALVNMKGTTPLTELKSDFKGRLDQINPNLGGTYNYAAETYDAGVVIALASELARSNDATVFSKQINGVTTGGEKCTDFAGCLKIIKAGGDPDYDGISGPLEFVDAGEPSVASFGVLQFGKDNMIDDSQTKFVTIGDPANATTQAPPAAAAPDSPYQGGQLSIGTLLPITGDLAFLGPPEVAAAQLVIQDINAAGGVGGKDIKLIEGDSGDQTTDTAQQTVDREINAGANAIIGAAASGVSLSVIDRVTAAGVVLFSPANTSDQFTTYDDRGLYFRTAPPDLMQGQAVANIVLDEGNNSIFILARNDPYGTGIADVIEKNLTDPGVAPDQLMKVIYEPNAQSFRTEVDQIVQFNPDAVVLIGFVESATILSTMNEQGVGPAQN
ncbi:MAG: ABC transporter substrate-binding protein [Geodermatophilaceae bacterium]